MRLGVLDVGSNTVHLLVVDAYPGARPLPAFSHKAEIRLADHLENGGRLSSRGEGPLLLFVKEARRIAEDKGVEDFVGFATSAIRDAVNGDEVLERITKQTGTRINVLGGEDEARLTFLAAPGWVGWVAGGVVGLDLGGWSLEIASGVDEEPDVAVSLPLGAVRLTRDWFRSDPPAGSQRRNLRRHVRAEMARTVGGILRYGRPDHAVATSKTFRQLARIAGAAPSSEGPYVRRVLTGKDLASWAEKLPTMTLAERGKLPGVSAARAPQLPAGAIVADAAMDLFGLPDLEICPWALREGVILRRLDVLTEPESAGT